MSGSDHSVNMAFSAVCNYHVTAHDTRFAAGLQPSSPADNYFECQKDVVLISSLLACWLGN